MAPTGVYKDVFARAPLFCVEKLRR